MSADRRLERELLARYEALLDRIADEVDESRFELAVELARLPKQVRGYGPIKSAAAARAREPSRRLLETVGCAGRRAEARGASERRVTRTRVTAGQRRRADSAAVAQRMQRSANGCASSRAIGIVSPQSTQMP